MRFRCPRSHGRAEEYTTNKKREKAVGMNLQYIDVKTGEKETRYIAVALALQVHAVRCHLSRRFRGAMRNNEAGKEQQVILCLPLLFPSTSEASFFVQIFSLHGWELVARPNRMEGQIDKWGKLAHFSFLPPLLRTLEPLLGFYFCPN